MKGTVTAIEMSEHAMRTEIYNAARAAGLMHEETVKTIQSAYNSVMNT